MFAQTGQFSRRFLRCALALGPFPGPETPACYWAPWRLSEPGFSPAGDDELSAKLEFAKLDVFSPLTNAGRLRITTRGGFWLSGFRLSIVAVHTARMQSTIRTTRSRQAANQALEAALSPFQSAYILIPITARHPTRSTPMNHMWRSRSHEVNDLSPTRRRR
jgi:hypothetical protein